jgi:predicted GTPase
MNVSKVIIMGAAGRDFHVFNTYFRGNTNYQVVAFTAAQIPDIDGRKYPSVLAGSLYPQGIPIESEDNLIPLIKEHNVSQVIFAYSDIPHEDVMHKASSVLAAGADFRLIGPRNTMIKSAKPVISVLAVRTGCGKSQTTRAVCNALQEMGKKVVVIRHPMPYGDLSEQVCQRFASYADLDLHKCTIEEREEYEPHIDNNIVVYAGVDYETIIRQAEKEADIVIWDGGNNDFSFYHTDLTIVVVDPHRAGHEVSFHPGETNLKMADIIVINKMDTANFENVNIIRANIEKYNPHATVIEAASPVSVTDPAALLGKRVLVIEDGPTLTHGHMTFGAGVIAAKKFGVKEIVEASPYAVGTIKETYDKYSHLSVILPAMGYGEQQVKDMEETIRRIDCDVVLSATPIDLTRVLTIDKPLVRVSYDLQEIGSPAIKDLLVKFK